MVRCFYRKLPGPDVHGYPQGAGVTLRDMVVGCTRAPLVAKMVTGTVCVAAVFEVVKVRVSTPLTIPFLLKLPVTPEGNGLVVRVTAPYP